MKQDNFFEKLEDRLNELFPKGHKHRAEAIMLNTWANIYHQKTIDKLLNKEEK